MARYRVTLQTSALEVVEADNPYQAAVLASARRGGDAEVTAVVPAVGRPTGAKAGKRVSSKKQTTKKVPTKKKRQISPETRAKLAQNLAKARAARAAKRKAATRKKRTTRSR